MGRERLRVGHYELRHVLGQGGSGDVWLASAPGGVPVAIKVVRAGMALSDGLRQAFAVEARAMAGLDHPNIVVVLDFGVVSPEEAGRSNGRIVENSPFLVTELVSGGSLSRTSPIGWADLRRIFLCLLDALAHAHARGVVHLDLKPANVLLPGPDDIRPGIKLTDFGLARLFHQLQGQEEESAGTPNYMAPEQLSGDIRAIGPWTDLYGFGCLGYALVAGQPPFGGQGHTAAIAGHMSRPPPRLQPRVPVPDGLEEWLLHLLQKDPRDRYRCAADAVLGLLGLGPPAQGRSTARTSLALAPEHTISVTIPSIDLLDPSDPPPPTSSAPTVDRVVPGTWRRPDLPTRPAQLVGPALGLYAFRTAPFVGREVERDHIWTALRAVAQSHVPRVVFVRGPEGSGKSRLVEWMGERASEVGVAQVVSVRHHEPRTDADGVVPALARCLRVASLTHAQLMHDRPLRVLTQAAGMDHGTLVDLLSPDLSEGLEPKLVFETQIERFGAMRSALALVAWDRPLVMVIDDLQLGLDTLAFVHHLVQTGFPILVLATLQYVDDGAPEFDKRTTDLLTLPEVSEIVLKPLDGRERRALVHGLLELEEPLIREVVERTAGNPLFTIQLLGDWVDRGLLQVGSQGLVRQGAPPELPENMIGIWRTRLERLVAVCPPEEMPGLELAAVLGAEVLLTELDALCSEVGVVYPLRCIERMMKNRLLLPLRRDGGETGVVFAHAMVRESLERTAGSKLTELHRACAKFLVGRRASPARWARHLSLSGQFLPAVEGYRLAATEAQNEARPDDEADLLRSAVAVLDQVPRDDRVVALRMDLYGRFVRLFWNEGRLEHAERYAQLLYDGAKETGDTALQASGLHWIGRVRVWRGELDVGGNDLQAALETARTVDDPALGAQISFALADYHRRAGNLDVARHWTQQSRELYESANDHGGVGHTWFNEGDYHLTVQQPEKARVAFERARDLFSRAGLKLGEAMSMNALGEVHRALGELGAAEDALKKAIRMSDAYGFGDKTIARINLALVYVAKGAHDRALEVANSLDGEPILKNEIRLQAYQHAIRMVAGVETGMWETWRSALAAIESRFAEAAFYEPEYGSLLVRAADRAWEGGERDRAAVAYRLALPHLAESVDPETRRRVEARKS